MHTLPTCTQDLWEYLAVSKKTVVLYGMGNGADKILDVCAQKGVTVRGVFASDGFVRNKFFHGMPVRTWSETKAEYGAENLIVLLAFGSSREDVLENILRIADEAELYAPDVPAFGDVLFDRAFYEAHKAELTDARALFSDAESLRIFDNVLSYKLTGDVRFLLDAESDMDAVWREIVCPTEIGAAADLGAYNGDTVRELIEKSGDNVQKIYAVEPDARNHKKLAAYAEEETRCCVIPVHAGAWSESTTLTFDKSGNRNASFGKNRSQVLASRPIKTVEIPAEPLDRILNGARVDYVKYDVEGSEKEALIGSCETIQKHTPTLLVSLYHRSEDLFALPLMIRSLFPAYNRYYLRRVRGIPAWDLNLYVKKED
ncbi:MAG: FkbM family methyltransferase [Clostridia bacterium]|nr:FkbM family methyltransferase [Clostridia bacterium]